MNNLNVLDLIGNIKKQRRHTIDKGYQYIKLEFFKLCQDRHIKGNTMLLLIFLRGIYCYLQRPVFNVGDDIITQRLGFTKRHLRRIRKELKEKGAILYTVYHGRGKEVEYTMLETVLLPTLKKDKIVDNLNKRGHIVRQKGT